MCQGLAGFQAASVHTAYAKRRRAIVSHTTRLLWTGLKVGNVDSLWMLLEVWYHSERPRKLALQLTEQRREKERAQQELLRIH